MLNKIKAIPPWLRTILVFPLLCLNGFLLILVIDYLQPLVSFLIIASILAFLLELLINLLEQKGLKRALAITIVLFSSLLLLITLTFILFPILSQQLEELLINAPKWIEQANYYFTNELPILDKFPLNFDSIIEQITGKISYIIKTLGSQTLTIVFTTINSIFNVLFIIILTIFLLIGGEKFRTGIFSWLPHPWQDKIPNYMQETFKDYFFSRLILVGSASVIRGLCFVLLGVPYGILFAFGIGLASLVPFLGGVVTILGTLLLIFKSGQLALLFFICATIIDQITDNVIAPRFMGELIGLNPVWLIIALFIGAKLGGLLGIFLAVPLASVVKKIFDDLRSENIEQTIISTSDEFIIS